MTETETLRQRRELVLLSCDLQRATLARRMGRLQVNPVGRAVGHVAQSVSRPLAWKFATAALAFATRAWQKRRRRKQAMRLSTKH